MRTRMWLFGLLLGVPLFGFAVAEGIQAYFNSELRTAARGQFTDVAPEAFSRLSVDLLCENASPEIQSLCTTNQHLNLMRAGAFWAGIVGLTLLLVIRLAGTVARTSPWLLLYLFKPGLYLTVLILVGLILVHAAVAMAALYYGESILAGRIHVFIIGAIGLGALIGILDMVSNAFALVQKVQTRVLGKIVSREQASALWQHVEDIAERLGALHPQHIVVGLDPNFFVTEADVVCLDGTLSGRTLYCSLPLCRILNTQEFSAIIGHELGHYKGQDTRFSQRFFPVYRGTIASILALHQQSDSHGARAIALLPAVAVLNYFLECFAVAEHRISRDRELVADQEGVTASDRDSMTSALVKVHAFAGYWQLLETAIAEALRQGNMYANTSRMFAKVVALQATSETLQDIGATHLTHPTDTHPPLSVRLEALERTVEAVSGAALSVQPVSVALQFLPEPEALEEEMSAVHQGLLALRLGIDLDSLKTVLTEASPQQSVEAAVPQSTSHSRECSEAKNIQAPDEVVARETASPHYRPPSLPKTLAQPVVQCWRCKSSIEVTPAYAEKK